MALQEDYTLNTQEQGQLTMWKFFFAFMHEPLGGISDEKEFHDAFPKVLLEYTKRCEPDLPFHHYTGGNERY